MNEQFTTENWDAEYETAEPKYLVSYGAATGSTLQQTIRGKFEAMLHAKRLARLGFRWVKIEQIKK